jgi:hypothetical protein
VFPGQQWAHCTSFSQLEGLIVKKKFLGLALVTGLALAMTPVIATPANAVGDYQFMMFSKSGITDPNEGQEDLTMKTALEEIGTVTVFDGGDGSAAAWTAAIAGKDALVFPEGNVYAQTSAMSAEAATVVKNWISAGGRALGTGSYTHTSFIDYLTGVTRTWNNGNLCPYHPDEPCDNYDLMLESATLPATISSGNYTGAISNWNDWTTEQKAGATEIYGKVAEGDAAIVQFAVGTGSFTYYAYDWYPDEDETLTVLPEWNEALRLGAAGDYEDAVSGGSGFALDLDLALEVGDTVAGADVNVSASGLQPATSWDLVLRSTPITLDFGTVGDGGSVASTVTIPAGLEPGWHTLTLTGTGADGKTYQRVASFLIAADGTLGEAVIYGEVTEVALADTGLAAAGLVGVGLLAVFLFFLAFGAFGTKGRIDRMRRQRS